VKTALNVKAFMKSNGGDGEGTKFAETGVRTVTAFERMGGDGVIVCGVVWKGGRWGQIVVTV